MKMIYKTVLIFGMIFCGFADVWAMDPAIDSSETPEPLRMVDETLLDTPEMAAPAPKVLRERVGWNNRTPQLRNRNNAQLNNCGYIVVTVSARVAFYESVDIIMKEFELVGQKLNPDEYLLNLFSFSVPITNELLARMPKTIGLARNARNLNQEQRQLLADQIKEVTHRLVEQDLRRLFARLELHHVVTENGNAYAYFYEREHDDIDEYWLADTFRLAINDIRAELEKRYRWGRNNQDGVWFSFQDARAIRPSLQFLTSNQPPATFMQRAMQLFAAKSSRKSGGAVSPRTSMSDINTGLSSSSKSILLSRGSEGNAIRPIASLHRTSVPSVELRNGQASPPSPRSPIPSPRSSLNHSPRNHLPKNNHSPRNSMNHASQESSPEDSPRMPEDKKIYLWTHPGKSIAPIIHMQPRVEIQTEIVNTESGSC